MIQNANPVPNAKNPTTYSFIGASAGKGSFDPVPGSLSGSGGKADAIVHDNKKLAINSILLNFFIFIFLKSCSVFFDLVDLVF